MSNSSKGGSSANTPKPIRTGTDSKEIRNSPNTVTDTVPPPKPPTKK